MKGRAGRGAVPAMALALAVFAVAPTPAPGQRRPPSWLPAQSFFEVPVAAPREPRFSGGLVSTDLLGRPRGSFPGQPPLEEREVGGPAPERPDRPDRESQIAVALGGTLRLWRPAEWAGGGVILGIQTGVFGRFRLEGSANTLVATDWLVGLPLEARRGRLSGRARFLHWSAHLGDEFISETGAEREDFTFEAVDLLAAWDLGPVRVYGGGARVLRSQLEDAPDAPVGFSDQGTVQAGADGGWYPWRQGTVGLRLGVDLQWSDRSDWRGQAAATALLDTRGGDHAFRLGLSWFDGPSPLGQFFLNQESLWGFEVRIDL